MTEIDEHTWGKSEYLDADEYKPGDTVKTRVSSNLGRLPYTAKDGTPKRAQMYKVTTEGIVQQFRLGIKNEILCAKMGIKTAEELVGKTLVLQVKKYPLGQGFVLIKVDKGVL